MTEQQIKNIYESQKDSIIKSLEGYDNDTQIAVMSLLASDLLAVIVHIKKNPNLIKFIFEQATKTVAALDETLTLKEIKSQ